MSALSPEPLSKSQLRQAALTRRSAVEPGERDLFTARLVERGVAFARQAGARVVSAFAPFRDEPDALALLAALSADGFATALPVTVGAGQPLVFRLWRPGEPTMRGALGIREPSPDAPAVDPDLLFVPLAAFDRRGHRIGYGAGHYDRTLRRLRAAGAIHAVGVAYSVCEVEATPDEPHDERLDFILTEREWIDARGAG
ncbi:MAG: 5-formyltetrahydrofolate cyclo-ligase [Hyphomicrobiales bacterium]|nr:5-formyltetrahydrofolate cyclo-ligase [Hyphomicrobiales bacterium]MBV8664736.1 5-formyltetrahydrofolate cyclo-ligase [Hyphomicrobiales bacterium]